jgi:hypothetical protein
MPFFVAEFIWLIFSFWCLYRILKLSETYFTPFKTAKEHRLWIAISLLCVLRFIMSNVGLIQVTIFLLWATLEALNMFDNKKAVTGSLLLAFAINVKLLPLVFLPYLIYRNFWKECLLTILCFGVFLFLPAIVIGFDYNYFLLTEWWKIINPSNNENVIEAGLGIHSLSALIPVYITNTQGELEIKRNFIDFDIKTVTMILDCIRLFFVVLALAFLKTLPLKRITDRTKIYWEISYIFLMTPLLFPHQHKYAFVYLLPLILYLVYFFMWVWKTKSMARYLPLIILCGLVFIVLSPFNGSSVIGWQIFKVLQHFKILSMAAILLIPVSLICNPNQLSKLQKAHETRDCNRSTL